LCQKRITAYQLEEQVQLTGLVQNIEEYYKAAHLMVHTSTYEGLPMVFAEALSYGIPIISSDCMPNNEIITHGQNGYIIQTDDLNAYVTQIMRTLANKDEYQVLSKNAIKSAQRFGIEKYVDQLLDSYQA
jgi:glycosyltransferase involved in cell wall biosynthesis